jgi:MFS family permease
VVDEQVPSHPAGAGGADRRAGLVQPPPVQMNARRIVVLGTALWFAAFVVLLPFYGWLGDHGHRIWLWTSLSGFLLGFVGYALMARHRRMGRTL